MSDFSRQGGSGWFLSFEVKPAEDKPWELGYTSVNLRPLQNKMLILRDGEERTGNKTQQNRTAPLRHVGMVVVGHKMDRCWMDGW